MKDKIKTIRISDKILEAAKKLGINTSEVARKAIEQEVLRQTSKCPTCGTQKVDK